MKKSKKPQKTTKALKNVLVVTLPLLLAAAIAWQIDFNRGVLMYQKSTDAFVTRTYLREALEGLRNVKTPVNSTRQIPEVNLVLAGDDSTKSRFLYLYEKPTGEYKGDLYITTEVMSNYAVGIIHGQDTEQIFKNVEQAQACERGFSVSFDDQQHTMLGKTIEIGSKTLKDGRVMHLHKETACHYEQIDEVGAYLLRSESY